MRPLYQYLFKKEVIEIIKKIISLENIKIIDVIDIEGKKSSIMYYLSWYCDSLQDILKMFFETEEYIKTRKNFLKEKKEK